METLIQFIKYTRAEVLSNKATSLTLVTDVIIVKRVSPSTPIKSLPLSASSVRPGRISRVRWLSWA